MTSRIPRGNHGSLNLVRPHSRSQAASGRGNLRWQSACLPVQRSRALTSFYVFIPDSQPLLNGDSDNDTVDCHGDTHVTLARL